MERMDELQGFILPANNNQHDNNYDDKVVVLSTMNCMAIAKGRSMPLTTLLNRSCGVGRVSSMTL